MINANPQASRINPTAYRDQGCPNAQRVQIGKALQKARLAAGLSLRELEKRSGMSASQISQIENGRRADPGFSTVLRLAKALEVSMDALAGLKEPRANTFRRMSHSAKGALERAQRQLKSAGQRIAEVLENDS